MLITAINTFNYHINKLNDIDDALAVSEEVFTPSPSARKRYQNKDDWITKINNDGLFISVYDKQKCIVCVL